MRINVTSVLVDDQMKALDFYTTKLGFIEKTKVDLGHAYWLTVVPPEDQNGTELLLEPDAHPAAKPHKKALVDDGIPLASFSVENVNTEYLRLSALGVNFVQKPSDMGTVTIARFDDTCGNLIQITSEN
jgi:catechol 2,3-dioxygenase-like lactoylglutathione lyase family enzyme